MLSLQQALSDAQQRLSQAGIDNPSLDARLLIAHALGCDRATLIAQSNRLLRDSEEKLIKDLLRRREAREPVARIIGQREFWGLPFAMNEATLEPRPDSETLIEAVLKVVDRDRPMHILDLGTGTGCLLLALIHSLPNAIGLGIDKSPRAIEQATSNAAQLGLAERVQFQTGDWLSGVTGTFDLILSNPPYIPAHEIPRLQPEVRLFDPLLALDGGDDGLAPYRALIPILPRFLGKGGMAAFEVGAGQAQTVADLMQTAGFSTIKTHADLGGVQRAVTAQL